MTKKVVKSGVKKLGVRRLRRGTGRRAPAGGSVPLFPVESPQAEGAPQPDIVILKPGDTNKSNPFTICIVSNPAVETPWNSGAFALDPITSNQAQFDACARYIVDSLFGLLPNQGERFIADPLVASKIRIVSLFVAGLGATDPNALVAQDGVSDTLVARRTAHAPFLARYGLHPDISYAVSLSDTHRRASAWYTSDDDSRPGVTFTLDGATLTHRYYALIPGTVAIHATATSLTALHEFGHALSSYTNGSVVDLYVDGGPGLNSKRGRPIPADFATYNGTVVGTDPSRGGLSYPVGWQSYHCALNNVVAPAVMDDYWKEPTRVPEKCEHDIITRAFLLDRLRAKTSR